jgi:signal transduction histidine kinase
MTVAQTVPTPRDRTDHRWFTFGSIFIVAWFVVWSRLPGGHKGLVAFSDTAGFLLITTAFIGMIFNALRSSGNARVFWRLMAAGGVLWAMTQGSWVYSEVIMERGVPDLFWGDFILFVHLIPMMLAVTGQPHLKRDQRKGGQQILDQVLLAIWWVYLYLITLAPWEFVKVDAARYSTSYNVLYMIEHVALLIAFAALYRRSHGAWKKLYQRFFIATFCYAIGSLIINIGLDLPPDSHWAYRSGSPYDMPWIASLIVWNWAVFRSRREVLPLSREMEEKFTDSRYSWSAIFSTAAALTTPVVALYLVLVPSQSHDVDRFRLFTMLQALIIITILVFIKQWVLNRALVKSLDQSRQAFQHLQKMQGQLLETEKLVAIGRLVAGAAHEINNPLTAIVGYSDLMATDDSVKPEHRDFAHKILQQARRTKSLVQNLLAFSKQSPAQRVVADMNAVALSAVQLQLLEHRNHHLKTNTDLAADLQPVLLDRPQVTQALLDIMNHATEGLFESGVSAALTIRTWQTDGSVRWSCSASGAVASDYTETAEIGFRLAASHSVIRDQGGELTMYSFPEGGTGFIVSFPAVTSAASAAAARSSSTR